MAASAWSCLCILLSMARVLVLNASFEPLTVVSERRAVCLMLALKVEVLHPAGRSFRSERLVVEVPSVVRLSSYVAVPRRQHRSLSRRAVLVRDGYSCQYCGGRAETVDHVLPRSRGGTHTWENVVAACRLCNARKRDRLPGETGMMLLRRPGYPSSTDWVATAAGVVPEVWMPYLDSRRDFASCEGV